MFVIFGELEIFSFVEWSVSKWWEGSDEGQTQKDMSSWQLAGRFVRFFPTLLNRPPLDKCPMMIPSPMVNDTYNE